MKIRGFLCVCAIVAASQLAAAQGARTRSAQPTYGELVNAGYEFLTEGKPKEAYVAALTAARMDPKRFESYALAAFVLQSRGAYKDAKVFLDKATSLAPSDKQTLLREIAEAIDRSALSTPQTATTTNLSATAWSGTLRGSYKDESGVSKPLEATFSVAFRNGGQGIGTYNSSPQDVTWTQNGRFVSVEAVLKGYGCPGKLTIRATLNGAAMTGVFSIRGAGCADGDGTFTAALTRAR